MGQNKFIHPATVIGLDPLPGLETTRTLAKHHIPIIAIAHYPIHYACRTSLCKKILYCNTQSDMLIDSLVCLGAFFALQSGALPVYGYECLLISRYRKKLGQWFYFHLPAASVLEKLINKKLFHRYAQNLGLPVPDTFILSSLAEAGNIMDKLAFPVIVKPIIRTPQWTLSSPNKVFKVENYGQFLPYI